MAKDNNIVFANNLTYYMNRDKIDRKRLCDDLNFKYSTVSEWLSGKKYPRIDKIETLADYFQIQKSDLIEEKKSSHSIVNAIPYEPQNMVPIPVIGRAAAGYNCLAETNIECYELVNPEMLNDGYEYAYLKVTGDSMEPLLLEGDMVLVRLQETVENNDLAVVIVDDEDGLVKQVEIDNDCVRLISQNPYYPPRLFKGREMNRLRIFGKVVECKRKFL